MFHGESERFSAAALLGAIVGRFVAHPRQSPSDLDQFEKLACGLIELLDAEAVADCAADLCAYPETPPGVFTALLEKGGRAARMVLERAPSLHAGLLRVTAEHGPAELAAAIARRETLDCRMIVVLASRGESEVLCALAANRRIHLDQAARRALAQRGRDDLRLARILLDRDDLSLDVEPLFLAADARERCAILLAATSRALSCGGPEPVSRPAPQILARIRQCARARDPDALAGALAEGLDCRKARTRAMLADPGGEALALALLTLGVDEELAIRIFLGAERAAPDVERVRALIALMRSIPLRAAQWLVAAITGAARPDRVVTPACQRVSVSEVGPARRKKGRRRGAEVGS
ncbi:MULTISPECIES: DUF2336 domain-containing protein [Methylosinus]|uniref:DUF2336 domain-containing protein n=1 Tax=Methylosinus trichosporium (strain ATCC 35070 / NCIMB 11131 / UNIQEM 75 / OB3b) TaxID=595536 RepID=A0A2D2CXS9_METT3|nr:MULTISPECIES: DUF2336 domain-containing protein [Methylosinus]ATQ67516.1 DUF2336 domain-containing protein [Methylosinus trichosporium OB3b]OBS51447.1 hypothetical protein A8B73_16120 [Methylosinus sp. 3S-1]